MTRIQMHSKVVSSLQFQTLTYSFQFQILSYFLQSYPFHITLSQQPVGNIVAKWWFQSALTSNKDILMAFDSATEFIFLMKFYSLEYWNMEIFVTF